MACDGCGRDMCDTASRSAFFLFADLPSVTGVVLAQVILILLPVGARRRMKPPPSTPL